MAYGLTLTGFVPKTLEIIREEINESLTDFFGPSLDLENGLLARFVGILAERYAELWELAEAVNSAQDPDKATEAALDALCLLTGTFRIEAASSTVTLTLTGTPTSVVPATSRASTTTTGKKFLTTASATIGAVAAWVASTAYAQGVRVTNASRVYQCVTAGTSAGAGGPTTTAAAITDNTVTWRYLGEGTGAIDVEAQATETGIIVAASGDITQIETPAGGWQSVINVLDATVGYDTQSDEALRLTREEELSQAGTSTAEAIRAEVLALSGVTSVTVFENTTDITDIDGVPAHSVEVLVRGGDDAAIGEALLDQVAAGVGTHGNTTTNPVDSEGVTHTIKFSRPAEINIGITISLVKDTTYPVDGDAQVEAAIVAFGNAQKCGKNAVASSVSAQAFKVTGVIDVSALPFIIGVAAPATPGVPVASTTISIGTRQLAVYDTSWITVITSTGTP